LYLCLCRAISENDVRRLGQMGVTSAKELVKVLGLNREECCGRCLLNARAFVETAKRAAEEASP
jgi:bacterioferritin-associated ferredoxin